MKKRPLALTAALVAHASLCCLASAHASERAAVPAFPPGKPLRAHESFEIVLNGPDAARVAVLVGKLDISALFARTATGLLYDGAGPALPAGDHTMTVYDIDAAGGWTQIGNFAVRFVSPRGFVTAKFEPTADVSGKGQFAERHTPTENSPERGEFQDATTQIGLRTELVRPAFTIRGNAQVTGVTHQAEALRFQTDGADAPRVDLSEYRADIQRGSIVLSLGHLNVGAQRHLINSFQSRGAAIRFGEGRPLSLELAALNGSNIVGWSNPLGLSHAKHRVWSATVGVEAQPQSPGLLRFEIGGFRGSSQPLSGFNEGSVVTAEVSRGATFRTISSTFGGRLRVDGAYTRSRFGEAFDREVEAGLEVTPVESRTADSRYVDVSVDLLQNRQFGSKSVTLTVNLRRDLVEPQFRSLGASLQSDLRSDSADVAFSVGAVAGTAATRRIRDNLGGIATILTTNIDASAFSLMIPVATMLVRDEKPARWAPTITVQGESTHERGDGIPQGFTADSVPDRHGWNLVTAADWQVGTWRIGSRFGRTVIDNRQLGSETFDIATNTGAVSFDWEPAARLSLGGELGLDRNRSEAEEKTDSTFRWAARASWIVYRDVSVAGNLTNIRAWDDLELRDSENIDGALELSSGFRLSRADRRKGRIFIRWVDRRSDLIDRSFAMRDARSASAFATGISMSMF